jgi:hypothetical protein
MTPGVAGEIAWTGCGDGSLNGEKTAFLYLLTSHTNNKGVV